MTYNKYEESYRLSPPIFPKERNEPWIEASFHNLGKVTVSETKFNELKKSFKLKKVHLRV